MDAEANGKFASVCVFTLRRQWRGLPHLPTIDLLSLLHSLMCDLLFQIIKNIVLAGIGQLTLCDPDDVTHSHLSAAFLFSEKDLHKNKALSALPHSKPVLHLHFGLTMAFLVRELNPRVSVHGDVRSFDLVKEDDVDQVSGPKRTKRRVEMFCENDSSSSDSMTSSFWETAALSLISSESTK
jgi:hypothetical protein